MRSLQRLTLFLLGSLAVLRADGASPAVDFPLKDGDVWVMAGDSITAQHLHSNYFEAFCFARYPDRKFAFRNSGVGGHTIPSTLARFDYDIAAWKPTVVSVELGMNDKGGTPTDKFIERQRGLAGRFAPHLRERQEGRGRGDAPDLAGGAARLASIRADPARSEGRVARSERVHHVRLA